MLYFPSQRLTLYNWKFAPLDFLYPYYSSSISGNLQIFSFYVSSLLFQSGFIIVVVLEFT